MKRAAQEVKTRILAMTPGRSFAADIASTLDWWCDAGVDCAFDDEPHVWLAEIQPEMTEDERRRAAVPPPAERRAPEAPAQVRIGGDRAAWPADLESFRQWWLTEPSLDGGHVRNRVASHGPVDAPLLVLVPQPEETDGESLLSGPQGALLTAMLAAMGIPATEVHLASVLPRHTPQADWAGLAAAGLADVLVHQLSLARPRAMIAFGRNIPPLLGHDPAQKTADLRLVNQEAPRLPVLYALELGQLAQRGGAKAAFWREWLRWSNTRTLP